MKIWCVASEDVGNTDLDRHIPCLLFLDGFSIIREPPLLTLEEESKAP